MAIPVRNQVVTDLLIYLENQLETDTEADRLHAELMADQTKADYQDLKTEAKLPPNRTPGGAYII